MQKKVKWILIPAGIIVVLFLYIFVYCAIATAGTKVEIVYVIGYLEESIELNNPLKKYAVKACIAEIEEGPVEQVERSLFEGGLIGGEYYHYIRIKDAGAASHRTFRNRNHGMIECYGKAKPVEKDSPFTSTYLIYNRVPEQTMELFQYCLELY